MINIELKKCVKCKIKIPTFNYEGKKKPLYCGVCKDDDMINVVSKKCVKCKIKRPSFNYESKNKLYCFECKEDGMINVVSKKCIKCKSYSPSFNFKGGKPLYCSDCKEDGMINIKSPKCISCDRRPSFNFKGGKPLYCSDCKEDDMIDVRHPHCISCNLYFSFKKYDYYCFGCFKYKFPNHLITRKNREKEKSICGEIQRKYPHLKLTFNKEIGGGCSKRRPDCLIELYTHTISIEVDEDQHSNYSCEVAKINDTFTDLGDRQHILIRINPDKYKDENGKIINGIFSFNQENKMKICNKNEYKHRIDTLFNTIDKYIPYQEDIVFKEIKLFYSLY